ncbi:MAG TPA: hypothetical protein VMR19_04340 [Candidatus Saccharimonadales bacterium]|nr:hypothetical protein [Candidatus Saccharimonadales bacterium]
MNINSFDTELLDLEWKEKVGRLNGILMSFLLPQSIYTKFWEADITELGVQPIKFGKLWWGCFGKTNGEKRLLILEFPGGEYINPGEEWYFQVATPPGRPGIPMTILVDNDGEIVPDLYYPKHAKIKILPISPFDWNGYAWHIHYPAIALQFLGGNCKRSRQAINRWQAYLIRNRVK